MTRSRLKRVIFCEALSVAGQRRHAVPDFQHDALYVDVRDLPRGTSLRPSLRKALHHEFFHVLDCRDSWPVWRDERWESLNAAGFQYGHGGWTVRDLPNTTVLTDQCPGFLNPYSTTAVEEDKAEVFANLIVNPAYVACRAKTDRVLKAKGRRMRELLVGFSPDMNDSFWEKVRAIRRPDE